MTEIESILSKYEIPKRTEPSKVTINGVEDKIGFNLPEDYKYFLNNYQGFGNSIGEEYVNLWGLEDLVEQNEGYFIIEELPGTIGIGSNGAGELIALEIRKEANLKVVLTPFIDLNEEYHINIGNSFTDFLQHLDKGKVWFMESDS
jgi:hypothetical protein